MNSIDLSKPEKVAIAQDSLILKFSLLGCLGLGLIGSFVFIMSGLKETPLQATGNLDKAITPKQTIEPPLVITKKPNKPIIIEEGSKAYYCLQNNGGSGCLTRDRFAPNYRVIAPPQRVKTYEDYLIQYGVRGDGYCGRYLNGQPNCY